MNKSVVGPPELCHSISVGLHQSARKRDWSITIHECESVSDVTREEDLEPEIDFLVFAFNSTQSLNEVETNICLIQDYYITSGSACIVNCSSVSNAVGFNSYRCAQIRDKYNTKFLSADVTDFEDRHQLGSRILNVAEALFGLNSGIPNMRCLDPHK